MLYMGVKMLSMAIHHNLWLNRDQRYAIHEGIELVVIGVSVPVWVSNDRMTTEPAKEVFCKYYLKNIKIDYPIQIVKDGYEIILPNRAGKVPQLTDDEWRHLNFNEPNKLNYMYNNCTREIGSKNLLDIKDGGSKSLIFREHNKVKQNDEVINFIHFVNILDTEELTNSLV